MSKGFATVEVKRQRGKLTVQGLGRTPRGQKYIKQTNVLSAPRMSDPKFKDEMATAVNEMLG